MAREFELFIPGPLPGLNEMIAAAKSGRRGGNRYAKRKKDWTEYIRDLISECTPSPMAAVSLVIRYYEPNRKRDKDNIAAGKKFIIDALVSAGVIPNDGWKHLRGWRESFHIDRNSPGVSITIREERNG